jgi:hypothetical protein
VRFVKDEDRTEYLNIIDSPNAAEEDKHGRRPVGLVAKNIDLTSGNSVNIINALYKHRDFNEKEYEALLINLTSQDISKVDNRVLKAIKSHKFFDKDTLESAMDDSYFFDGHVYD